MIEVRAFREPLPMSRWDLAVGASDLALLAHCVSPTLDIGCGPGRMTAHLTETGERALGIDVSAEAVRLAHERGAAALRLDVFGPVPGEGAWQTALLADGNIGIGGDPVALLRRVHELVAPGGRAVADVAEYGVGLRSTRLHVSDAGATRTFPWAMVGADSVGAIAAAAGWALVTIREFAGRWYVVMAKEGG